jgi:hypothetical protein
MKPKSAPKSPIKIALAPLALALLLLAGCFEQGLTWSPDGKRAAVISNAGLFLCGADGTLSPPLMPDVLRVAWLSDSQQLVLAKKIEVNTWAPIARALGAPATEVLVAKAEDAWKKFQAGANLSEIVKGRDERLIKIYLRERHGEALQAKLKPDEWKAMTETDANISQLITARIDGDKVVPIAQLYEGVDEVISCRIAADDRAVAFVTDAGKDGQLWVVAMDASPPVLVANQVAFLPDWTADARSLVYLQASGVAVKDDLRLGTLVRREVLDASGKIKVQPEQKYLAGWIFSEMSRVRCLRDGRILFNAAEISLPIAAEDYGEIREQLFAIDPARQSTLVRMIPRKAENHVPKMLSFFEVSPDEQQVVCGDLEGGVSVLTLSTGEVQEIQASGRTSIAGFPVWRATGEFSYTRRTEPIDGKEPVRLVEIVLRKGDTQRVLSTSWPDERVNEFVTK